MRTDSMTDGPSLVALLPALFAFVLSTTICVARTQTSRDAGNAPPPDATANDEIPVADGRQPGEGTALPGLDPEKIEQAKQLFRKSRRDAEVRLEALRILYPLIRIGTSRNDVSMLLGSPDSVPSRGSYSRFLNYVIGPQQWVEIEFDREQKQVVRKVAHGLDLDPPDEPIPPIAAEQRAWLGDYPVAAADPEERTTLRAGFTPEKPEIVRGEPLTLTMTVANIGNADFEFMFGGDYRSTGRHDRIKINVTDAAGKRVDGPVCQPAGLRRHLVVRDHHAARSGIHTHR